MHVQPAEIGFKSVLLERRQGRRRLHGARHIQPHSRSARPADGHGYLLHSAAYGGLPTVFHADEQLLVLRGFRLREPRRICFLYLFPYRQCPVCKPLHTLGGHLGRHNRAPGDRLSAVGCGDIDRRRRGKRVRHAPSPSVVGGVDGRPR